MTVWLNGRLLPASEAQVDPDDRGLLLGDGLVETMLSLGGTPVEFDAHWARLAASVAVLGIPLPIAKAEVCDAVTALLTANGLHAAGLGHHSEAAINRHSLALAAALPSSEHLREKGRDARARPWATGPPGGGAGAEKV